MKKIIVMKGKKVKTVCVGHTTRVYSPKQGSVTSLSLTLPVPLLHVHETALPPPETLFEGQGMHMGSPAGLEGSR